MSMPTVITGLREIWNTDIAGIETWRWATALGAVAASIVLALGVTKLGEIITKRITRRHDIPDRVTMRLAGPNRALITVLFARLALELSPLPRDHWKLVTTTTTVLCIVAAAWICERLLEVVTSLVLQSNARKSMDADTLARRRTLKTQMVVTRRILSVAIAAIGAALVALQFDAVRSVGVSLLASAGLAGVVLGFAAQRSIEALLAGLQLTFSQPIRIGDTVVIEKEFGVIDDIRLTHVAVQLWDQRRLIVPTPKLLEGAFENWSRSTTGLLGTVFIRVHHLTPIDEMRKALDAILEGDGNWDRNVKSVQVTDAGEDSIEVRVLVSASEAGKLWDLRVAVRERLVRWLAETEGGAYLPRARWAAVIDAHVDNDGADAPEPRSDDSGLISRRG